MPNRLGAGCLLPTNSAPALLRSSILLSRRFPCSTRLVGHAQSAYGSWQIGFTNAGWQFAVGQDVAVTLFIDRVPCSLMPRYATFSLDGHAAATNVAAWCQQGHVASVAIQRRRTVLASGSN